MKNGLSLLLCKSDIKVSKKESDYFVENKLNNALGIKHISHESCEPSEESSIGNASEESI